MKILARIWSNTHTNQALISGVGTKDRIRKFIGEKGLGDGEPVLVGHWKFIRYFMGKRYGGYRGLVGGKGT